VQWKRYLTFQCELCGKKREEDCRETVAQWTSLADVQIFSLITSEFAIELDSALIEAETVGDLLAILERKGAFRK
jgi:hypothetical protein